MADEATRSTTIDASTDECLAAVVAFERYPTWAHDVKSVEVVERDADGRGLQVAYRTAALGRSTSYTLRYDYSRPMVVSWELVKGDITRRLDGRYEFSPSSDGGTDVTYHLSIDLAVPLPGFIKRRAEERIINNALSELKAHIETSAPDPS